MTTEQIIQRLEEIQYELQKHYPLSLALTRVSVFIEDLVAEQRPKGLESEEFDIQESIEESKRGETIPLDNYFKKRKDSEEKECYCKVEGLHEFKCPLFDWDTWKVNMDKLGKMIKEHKPSTEYNPSRVTKEKTKLPDKITKPLDIADIAWRVNRLIDVVAELRGSDE